MAGSAVLQVYMLLLLVAVVVVDRVQGQGNEARSQ